MAQTTVKYVVRIRTPMKPANDFAQAVWQTMPCKTVAPTKLCTTTNRNAFCLVQLASIPKRTHALIVKRGLVVKAVQLEMFPVPLVLGATDLLVSMIAQPVDLERLTGGKVKRKRAKIAALVGIKRYLDKRRAIRVVL